MATYSNIYIDQGSTYSSIIDVKDSNGLPFNLTGYESRGQIRKSYSSANTTVFATNINLPLEGKVAVSLTAGQTRSLKAGRYIYDVEIFNDGGHVVRIAEGQVEINPGIANDDAVVLPPTPVLIEIIDDRIDDRIDNFNLNQIITLNGDAIGSSGTGLINVSLATTGVAAGTYGGTATSNRTFTVDSKGRITAVGAATTITPSFASITGKPNSISGYNITDAASKTYVDEITSHETVRVITKQALALNYSNTNFGQLISNTSVNWTELLSDPGLVLGSRLLIAGQSTKAHNGIYVIVDNTTLQRAVDFNSSRKMAGGDTVFVTHGIYADTCWALRETVTAVGTSPVEFVQISGAGAVEVGNGLVRNGTTIGMSTIGTAGTYRSVTTDAYGRVTTGSNPTTLEGYGITDAVTRNTAESITGQKTFESNVNVPLNPTEATHAVSKSYVDAVAEEINQPALIRTAAEGPPLDNTTNADFVGQLLRVGNAAPYRWFRALTSGINISTWTEDVDTTSTILKKLQGEEEDPNKIGKEYLPVGVDPQLDPVAVADSAARKLASTYVNAGITPYVGLRVIQTDQPDVVWTLLSITNITLDANWAGTPRTNANGQLPLKGIKLVDGNIPLSFSQHISIDDIRWIKNSSANVLPLLTSVQIPGSLMVPGNKIAFTGNYRYFKNSGGVGTNCFFTFGPKTLWDEVNNSPNGGYLSTVYFPQVPFAVVPADLNAVGYFHSVFTLTSVTTDPTKLYLLANTNFPDGGATSIVDGVLSYETLPLPTGTVNSSGLHTYLVGADTEVIVGLVGSSNVDSKEWKISATGGLNIF